MSWDPHYSIHCGQPPCLVQGIGVPGKGSLDVGSLHWGSLVYRTLEIKMVNNF